MNTSPRLEEQLASLGICLPAWPEEPEGDDLASGWIKRGQAYAEGIRLLRAQLRTAAAIEGIGGKRVVSIVQSLGRQSSWDQSMVRYLLSELQGASDYQRVQTAAKLMATNCLTAAQRLGAALELAQAGFLVCGVDAIKQLVEAPQVRAKECLDLCALLVAQLPLLEADSQEIDPKVEILVWLENVSLHLQATSILATAASVACGEQNRAGLVTQLNSLLVMAAQSKTAAFQRLEYLYSFLVSERIGKEHHWAKVNEILDELAKSNGIKYIKSQVKTGLLGDLLRHFQGNEPSSNVNSYAQLNEHRNSDIPLPVGAGEAFEASARIIPNTPLVLIQNSHEAIYALRDTPFWVANGNVRTGSTMVFNLMRILANSLTDGAISAWVGDFSSPQKFFETIEESHSIISGVLKSHNNDESVNQRLRSGHAKAVLTHRNMRDCCYSYWRMLGNKRSPFYKESPSLNILEGFINKEIKSFQNKAKQPGTLLVKEDLLRVDTERAVEEICEFLGLSVYPEFRFFLAQYLGQDRMAERANAMAHSRNSTGHESATFLHPEHVSTQGSINSCSQDAIQEIDRLLRQTFQSSLDENHYIRLG